MAVLGTDGHGEGGGRVVYVGPDRGGAGAHGLAVHVDLGLDLGRRHPHRERAQAQAELAHLTVALLAGGGTPQRRVRLLAGFGLHPAPGHRPVLPLKFVLVVRPAADDVLDGFLPHGPGVLGVDAEPLELHAGGAAARAEIDATVADEVEDGHRLRRAHRVVVGLGHEPHAVAESDALGPRGDGPVEHLGVGAVRVLLQEVVLHRPEGVPPVLVPGDRLLERVLVGAVLAVGVPRLGHRDLVEQGEFHRMSLLGSESSLIVGVPARPPRGR